MDVQWICSWDIVINGVVFLGKPTPETMVFTMKYVLFLKEKSLNQSNDDGRNPSSYYMLLQ